jgi:hypothetical protein
MVFISQENCLLFLMRRVMGSAVLSGGNCLHATLTISFGVCSLGAVCSCEGACLAGWPSGHVYRGEEGQRAATSADASLEGTRLSCRLSLSSSGLHISLVMTFRYCAADLLADTTITN